MADLVPGLIHEALKPVPSELASVSDRLRPPYGSPVLGAIPAGAGPSRDLEVGFDRLPMAYQRALLAAPPRSLQVGTMPSGHALGGFVAPEQPGVPQATMLAENAPIMSHELVHELLRRWENPLSDAGEERLAATIYPGGAAHRFARILPRERSAWDTKEAWIRAMDQGIRSQYGDSVLTRLQHLFGGAPARRPLGYMPVPDRAHP